MVFWLFSGVWRRGMPPMPTRPRGYPLAGHPSSTDPQHPCERGTAVPLLAWCRIDHVSQAEAVDGAIIPLRITAHKTYPERATGTEEKAARARTRTGSDCQYGCVATSILSWRSSIWNRAISPACSSVYPGLSGFPDT